MNIINEKILRDYINEVELALQKYNTLNDDNLSRKTIIDAINYSLGAGGKRIRPVLTLEFCRICGGDYHDAFSAACAVEMIHTFSLIHDDLPAMDDDDFRRGKPSCHVQFGQAIAILAGDALSVKAFEIIACDNSLSSEKKISLIKILSEFTGVLGMIGGQVIDIQSEGLPFADSSPDTLTELNMLKTSALLRASCLMGCVCADADQHSLNIADSYAQNLGMAFQIVDDILNVTGNRDILGKPIGNDADKLKNNFVSLYGIDKSRQIASQYTKKSLELIASFDNNHFLTELTEYLLIREK